MYSWMNLEGMNVELTRLMTGTLFYDHVSGVIENRFNYDNPYRGFYDDPEYATQRFIQGLKDVGNAIETVVASIVTNTIPTPLDAQQRMKELCNLWGISFKNLSLLERNFIWKAVTTKTHRALLHLFFKNGHLCAMSEIQEWTNIHTLFLAFSTQTEFLNGSDSAYVDVDNLSENAKYEEHRLMVYVEMMKFYTECVKRGIFPHSEGSRIYEPLVYSRV